MAIFEFMLGLDPFCQMPMSTLLPAPSPFFSETLLLSSMKSFHSRRAMTELGRNKGLIGALCRRYMVPQHGFRVGLSVPRLVKVEAVDDFSWLLKLHNICYSDRSNAHTPVMFLMLAGHSSC